MTQEAPETPGTDPDEPEPVDDDTEDDGEDTADVGEADDANPPEIVTEGEDSLEIDGMGPDPADPEQKAMAADG